MPRTATKPFAIRRYKQLSRWCSRCIATSPRKITEQGEPDEVDRKFWQNHVFFISACPSCGNEVKDFFTSDEVKDMTLVGILK